MEESLYPSLRETYVGLSLDGHEPVAVIEAYNQDLEKLNLNTASYGDQICLNCCLLACVLTMRARMPIWDTVQDMLAMRLLPPHYIFSCNC